MCFNGVIIHYPFGYIKGIMPGVQSVQSSAGIWPRDYDYS